MADVGKIIRLSIMYAMVVFWGMFNIFITLITIAKKRTKMFQWKKREFPPKNLVDGWNHGRIKLSDVSLHYVSAGDDGKPLMLMVHGFPEFWYTWRNQLNQFDKDFKVVAIDMRGYGESDKPAGKAAYDMELLTKDIAEMIEALDYKSCTLMAHDWGGAVCWATAAKYPQLIDRLIICNCPHPVAMKKYMMRTPKQLLKSWYMFAFQWPIIPEFTLRADDYAAFKMLQTPPMGCVNGKKAMTDEDLEAWKYTFSQPGALTPPINYYRQNLWRKVEDVEYPKIEAPVLIIWGTKDGALSTELAKESMDYCTNVTVKYVEGASHWVQQDEPTIVNQHIQDFVNTS